VTKALASAALRAAGDQTLVFERIDRSWIGQLGQLNRSEGFAQGEPLQNSSLAAVQVAQAQRHVRGHEKVPGFGQLKSPLVAMEVLAGGHQKSPLFAEYPP
jgi:hypothetical protein